jgi:shikimate kinase
MALILCGFICAGKTTLGEKCAEKLQIPFHDSDRMIEAECSYNKSISEIWEEIGKEKFRNLETKVLLSLNASAGIIALGGGALERYENQIFLQKIGRIIYLKAPLNILYQRMIKRGLPAFLDQKDALGQFTQIANERIPVYETCCHHLINTEIFAEKELVNRIAIFYGRQ